MKTLILFTIASALCLSCGKSPFLDSAYADNSSKLTQPCSSNEELHLNKISLTIKKLWLLNPVSSKYSSLILTFQNPEGQLFDLQNKGYAVNLSLYMSSMGHGTTPVKIIRLSTGVYKVYDMWFSMTGPWEIIVEVKKDGANIDEGQWNINIEH